MLFLWFRLRKTDRPFSGGVCFFQMLPVLALLCFVSGAFGATIELKESSAVAKTTLTLGDVATITGPAPQNFAALSLGASPLAGTSTRWTREGVAQVVAAKFPQEKFIYQGAEACRVERPGRLLQVEEVEARLEEELSKLTAGGGQAQVKEISSWSDIMVPEGPLEFSFAISPTTLRSAWSGANMKLSVNGEAVVLRSVRFRWSWLRPAWQARANLAAGTPLDLKDFEAVTVDVLQQPIPIYIGEELPADMSLTRGCVAGRILLLGDMKAQTVVKRGMPVTLRYQKGALTIQVQATALQDGARGEVIAVQNTATRKKLMARVTDSTTLDYVQ